MIGNEILRKELDLLVIHVPPISFAVNHFELFCTSTVCSNSFKLAGNPNLYGN